MTLHDPAPPRKPPAPPRVSRFWLYAPYAALVVAILAWSLLWVFVRSQVASRMDAAAAQAREAGFAAEWKDRRIGGYPFRIDVTLGGVRLGEPSGWALAAPEVKAGAYVYRVGDWIGYAPKGVVLTRPVGGPVAITGQAVRASWIATGQASPRIAVEGLKLTFAPEGGAARFLIDAAEHMDFHLRPDGPDKAEFLLRIDAATAGQSVLLGQMAQGRPMDIAWQGVISNLSALHGRDWPSAAAAWTGAGGGLDVEHGYLNAGPLSVNLRPGRLTLGGDGRLRGSIGLDLKPAAPVIRALAAARTIDPSAADSALAVVQAQASGGPAVQTDLSFLAGQTLFGPVAIGPAPKVY